MLVVLGVLAIGLAGLARGASGDVVVLTATGVVDNVMAGYLEDGIAQAAEAGAPAVVVKLNTPGGEPGRDPADHRRRCSRRTCR